MAHLPMRSHGSECDLDGAEGRQKDVKDDTKLNSTHQISTPNNTPGPSVHCRRCVDGGRRLYAEKEGE